MSHLSKALFVFCYGYATSQWMSYLKLMQVSARSTLSGDSNARALCVLVLPKDSTAALQPGNISVPCYRFSHTCGLEIEVDPYSTAHAS